MARDPEHDLVIRNGLLADGTGAPLREADVAVTGGGVAEVGTVTGRGRREIGAAGALERRPRDIDCAAYVPHGAMRVHAMGERAVAGEPASDDDIAAMAALAREAVAAGAMGFSTSRTLNHRSSTGEPTPSLTASAAELAGIAAGVAAARRGVLQVVSDFLDVDEEWVVLRHMAETSGRPLTISVAQIPERPTDHR